MPANGEEKARTFYHETLGFDEIEKPESLQSRGGYWFTNGKVEVHLGVEKDFHPAVKAHPAFRVADLQALENHLSAKGFSVTLDNTLSMVRRFYLNDIFGNRIEFIQDGDKLH